MQNRRRVHIGLDDRILAAMRRCVLLQTLDDDSFKKVVSLSHTMQLPSDSILFEQNAPLTDIYLLVSGGIKLLRLAPSGDEKVIDIIQPGQTFAEAALFLGSCQYPVTAITLVPSIVVGFKANPYLELLKSSNKLCLSMLGKLSQRLHWMVNEVDRLTLHNATFRLVDYLLNEVADIEGNQTALCLVAPKRIIASRLSIKPETLSRTLKELEREGLIVLHGSQIELIDVERLKALVSLDS